ncbi:MAG: phage tail sheath protein [Tissierellia bacterium]|nr:phage tail sheath protein [Tissierellia bacterium]
MPTIGMPKIQIEFESMGLTAIQRSERGIVLLILKETAEKPKNSFRFASLVDVEEDDFSEEVKKYVDLAFEASPNLLLVETYDGTNRTLANLLKDLVLQKFNYYATPNLEATDIKTVLSWHKDIVKKKDKTIKYVGFEEVADDENIINFATTKVVYDKVDYTGLEFTALIASQLAALPLTRSFTFFTWPKISYASLDFVDDEDAAVNAGKLFLTYDGEKYKIARGVNSLTTCHEDKGEDFSKIRIVEAMHLIKDDISETFNNFYVGKILNKYENKQQFIALINQVYFLELQDTILEKAGNSRVDIDMVENRKYAIKRGQDVEKMTAMEIKTYNTGSNVFLEGTVSLLDAMEDLKIRFRNQ